MELDLVDIWRCASQSPGVTRMLDESVFPLLYFGLIYFPCYASRATCCSEEPGSLSEHKSVSLHLIG